MENRRRKLMEPYVLWAFATFVCFGITNFLLKKVTHTQVQDQMMSSIILWVAVGIAGVVGLTIYVYRGQGSEIVQNFGGLKFAFVAGLFLAVGMFTLIMGMASGGKAGVVVAIAQANAAVVAILAFIFLKESLTVQEMAGMGLVFAGIGLMVVK